jgi:hypothetical protein
MNAKVIKPIQLPAGLAVVATLASLLQRLEGSTVPVSPAQYRSVAERLADTLRQTAPSDALNAVLSAFPAAAEVYENLNYQHAGLCRSPLEAGLNAELQARQLIQRVARPR